METNWGTLIKEIGRGAHGARDLSEEDAYRMFAAMLDGCVPELELDGIMIALRIKGESAAELRGFQRAAGERMRHLAAPAGAPRPVVLPTAIDAKSTAEWTRQALAGGQPVPEPLVQQLACCCYAAGRAGDFGQALTLANELVRPVAQAH